MKKLIISITVLILLLSACSQNEGPDNSEQQIPYLKKQGNATQLIVDGKPFIILGGELGNSTFTSVESMEPVWEKLKALNVNTVLAPVYWELIEPTEGKFNFTMYDELIKEARKHNLKLVLLWFGSWKNSMSSHAPAWVKTNQKRFPRIKDDKGISHEILSPFSEENLQADLQAYLALIKHIKEFDSNDHTVIMMQVENEIGMLPSARDHNSFVNKKFKESVPQELVKYLKDNKDKLVPEFKEKWAEKGYKETGNWEEVFGKGPHTDEIFMAWYYSKFTNKLIEEGKRIYPLPSFVNASLNRPGWLPGQYPSAGPLPHLMDVWKAAGPSIDFLSPDFYFPNIEYWCDLYTRQGNPLLIPEHALDNTAAAKAAFTIGHYESLGFSPFGIENVSDPETDVLGKMYGLIHQLIPIITSHQGSNKVEGVLLDKDNQETVLEMGDYELTVKHSHTLGYEEGSKNETWESAGAIIVQTGENEFYLAGSGIVITFRNLKNPSLITGILKTDQGSFKDNKWHVLRHLNGDQTHQGRHIRLLLHEYSVLRFELYNYE